jgi:uncharacterized protein (DUF1778 family)
MTDSTYPIHSAAQISGFEITPSVNPPASSGQLRPALDKGSTTDVGKKKLLAGKRDDMASPKEKVSFSGRLLVRTNPAIHESVHDAAKLAGRSINAWIEQTISKTAQEELLQAAGTPAKLPPPSLSLLDDESDELAALVDDVRPRLKSQKTASIFAFIGAVEMLQMGLHALRQCLRDDRIDTVSELLDAIVPFLKQPDDLVAPEFGEALTQFFDGLEGIRKCIKNEDTQNTLQVLAQVIDFFSAADSTVNSTEQKINPQ